jgi:hypothetical protein
MISRDRTPSSGYAVVRGGSRYRAVFVSLVSRRSSSVSVASMALRATSPRSRVRLSVFVPRFLTVCVRCARRDCGTDPNPARSRSLPPSYFFAFAARRAAQYFFMRALTAFRAAADITLRLRANRWPVAFAAFAALPNVRAVLSCSCRIWRPCAGFSRRTCRQFSTRCSRAARSCSRSRRARGSSLRRTSTRVRRLNVRRGSGLQGRAKLTLSLCGENV